jgi:nucleoside 2-deoxyribosyltransferase
MKIFCTYAYTGEDVSVITVRMRMVVDTLTSQGHEVYCNMFDPATEEIEKRGDFRAIFKNAFEALEKSEEVVAIITSPNRSVGQLIEIGAALSQGKPVHLFEHVSAKDATYLPKLVAEFYEWSTDLDLKKALENI